METMNLIPTKKRSKFSKFMKTPIKLLAKARDLYIIGMGGIGGVMGSPTGQVVNSLPKSYSVNASRSSSYNEDYRELVRAASSRLSNNKDLLQRQPSKNSNNNMNMNMPRSFSVGIGRIAEDKPCDFDDEIKVKPADVFPRSRSYAVGSTRTGDGFKR